MDLAQVFQMLALNKKVGLLSIQSTKLWKVLYFDQRGVSVHHSVHRVLDRAVAAFVRTGRLTEAVVDEVRDHAARSGQPLMDSLLAGGYLDAQELEDQYRIELEEEIYDLFFCRDAKFEFHEGADRLEGHDGTVDERFFFNCDSVIMEAARRIDEWTYISERVPTTAEVLVATADSIDGEQFGADGPAVFELLDGRRNVARVVEITGLSNFQVCKVLSQLLEAGAIAPVAAEELVPMAEQCMAEGRLQDAISLYERAVGLGVGVPEVHTLAANAYQSAEEYEHAVYHLHCEAEHRIGAGDRAGAARRLHEAMQLVPTDLQARERLVELTLGPGGVVVNGFDPVAEGKCLVDLLLEFGDVNRVRTLLERLIAVAPDDPDLKKSLVNVHIKAGDQKRVVELYESIANDLVHRQRPLEAVGYLQKILLIDRSRGDVSERVRHLYEFDERSRRRGRLLTALAVLFCLLLVLGSGYWFYGQRAEADYATIDVQELVAREDFAGAATVYEEFVRSHPFTAAAAKASADLQQVEAARQRFEARRTAERASRDRELQKARIDYKAAWQRHREQFLSGQPEQSMQSLAEVRDLVAKTGKPDDMAWALEQQVERTWTKLRDWLSEAERLQQDYRRHRDAGEWQQARAVALRLHAEFETTQAAASADLPVTVRTRPAGATLTCGGKPVEESRDGATVPVRTPTTVLFAPAQRTTLVAELEGFEDRNIEIDALNTGEVEVVLEVKASARIAFDAPVQTGVGIGDGWLAVGLRGGRLGLARVDGSGAHHRDLGGLKAVDATPVVQNGRVFFLTNENTVECVAVESGVQVEGWPVQLASGSATPLAVREGRVVLVDRDHVLHCWEQFSARPLWKVSLDSAAAGIPVLDRRLVYVGTVDGRLLVVDASDGTTVAVWRCPAALTTRVVSDRGQLFFGCNDANVRAAQAEDGRVLWTVSIGRTLADEEIAVSGDTVLVLGRDHRLVALDRNSGRILGELAVDGVPQRGMRVQGGRALLQLRRAKGRSQGSFDVLQAVTVAPLAVQWEYADQGLAPGATGLDSGLVGWPSANGEVVLFR